MARGARSSDDVVRTFALRLARRCLLEQLCPKDHPVLDTERQLVEMARSKLQEHLTIFHSRDDFEIVAAKMRTRIVELAEKKTRHQIDDDALCHAVINAIRMENLDDLVPVLN